MSASRTHLIATAVITSSASEDAAFVLSQVGCEGIIEEPAGSEGAIRIRAYFAGEETSAATLEGTLRQACSPFPELEGTPFEIASVEDEDWSASFKQYFSPFAIAPGMIVVPSWEEYLPAPDERIIRIDPGMAFGTGLHPTTRLCARELVRLSRAMPEGPRSLLDLGTGSGILAILWRLLREGRLAAVDNDPDAVAVAAENLAKNSAADAECALDLSSVSGSFEVVVANILLNTLLELRDQIARRVVPGGFLILSGITHDQEEAILAAYAPAFGPGSALRDGEWSAITFQRS